MGTIRKVQILIVLKLRTPENVKFYISKIKWVYSILKKIIEIQGT